jgi:hypothetical protein
MSNALTTRSLSFVAVTSKNGKVTKQNQRALEVVTGLSGGQVATLALGKGAVSKVIRANMETPADMFHRIGANLDGGTLQAFIASMLAVTGGTCARLDGEKWGDAIERTISLQSKKLDILSIENGGLTKAQSAQRSIVEYAAMYFGAYNEKRTAALSASLIDAAPVDAAPVDAAPVAPVDAAPVAPVAPVDAAPVTA